MRKESNALFCAKHSLYHKLFNNSMTLFRPETSHHVFCFGSFKVVIFSVRVSTPTVSIQYKIFREFGLMEFNEQLLDTLEIYKTSDQRIFHGYKL